MVFELRMLDIDHKCKEFFPVKQLLESKRLDLHRLTAETTKKTREAQILEEIAKLRGETYEGGHELDKLKETEKELEDLQEKVKDLEREIFKGLEEITFDMPKNEPPTIDSKGISIIKFEGGPYDYLVKFISTMLGSDIPAKIDDAELHPDKIIVTNIRDPSDPMQVIEKLKNLRNNIIRLAHIGLGEKDPDVEEIADALYESKNREIWEAIKGRKTISYEVLQSELGLKTPKEQKKARNFFTNLEIALKDKFPFIRTSPGTYELTFFGSLLWKRYCDKHPRDREVTKELPSEVIAEKSVKKEETSKKFTLNNYLPNEDDAKKIIYGKKVG